MRVCVFFVLFCFACSFSCCLIRCVNPQQQQQSTKQIVLRVVICRMGTKEEVKERVQNKPVCCFVSPFAAEVLKMKKKKEGLSVSQACCLVRAVCTFLFLFPFFFCCLGSSSSSSSTLLSVDGVLACYFFLFFFFCLRRSKMLFLEFVVFETMQT